MDYSDNEQCLHLLEAAPMGIFLLLESACAASAKPADLCLQAPPAPVAALLVECASASNTISSACHACASSADLCLQIHTEHAGSEFLVLGINGTNEDRTFTVRRTIATPSTSASNSASTSASNSASTSASTSANNSASTSASTSASQCQC